MKNLIYYLFIRKTRATILFVASVSLVIFAICYIGSNTNLNPENNMQHSLTEEIKSIRNHDKSSTIDVTDIVNKFISIGDRYSNVYKFLASEGFETSKTTSSGEDFVIADKRITPKHGGFYDELRLVISIENGVVKKINAKLIFRSI